MGFNSGAGYAGSDPEPGLLSTNIAFPGAGGRVSSSHRTTHPAAPTRAAVSRQVDGALFHSRCFTHGENIVLTTAT
jgi:hypothetical protein